MKNWKGLALDGAGWAAMTLFPEASVAGTVVGSTLGVVGIGLAVVDNKGPVAGVLSGTLAYTGKQAAVAEWAFRGMAAAMARRVGVVALATSTVLDASKAAHDYHTCRSAN